MCRCSRPKRLTAARRITDGCSDAPPANGTPIPGHQARDDGDVHLPGVRGDVLRESLRDLLLLLRLAHPMAAAATIEHARVLRPTGGHSRHPRQRPCVQTWP